MKSHESFAALSGSVVQALNDPQVQSALVQAAQETGTWEPGSLGWQRFSEAK